MKNNYIVNGKNVIDIIFDLPKKGKSKIRYFLLEDNTKIKAINLSYFAELMH